MEDYGLETVQAYMYHIRRNAEMCVRNLLRDVAKRAGTNVLTAIDYLDDGSPVSSFPFLAPLCVSRGHVCICICMVDPAPGGNQPTRRVGGA